jgi:ribosome-binding protein aMBF1 (putative translation factor)
MRFEHIPSTPPDWPNTAMDKSLYSDEHRVLLTLLRRHRQQRRLRQVDLANLIGRDQALVSKVESGDRRLDLVELRAWLRALGKV